MHKPQPIHRPGLEILALEIERAQEINSSLIQENSQLKNKNQELEQRIEQLEKIISSYQDTFSSGTNNVVLL